MKRIIWLTLTLIFIQLLFAGLHYAVSGMAVVQRMALTGHSALLLKPFLLLLCGQLLLYAGLVYLVWITATNLIDLFSIREGSKGLFTTLIFLLITSSLLALHLYYVPHSFFTQLILESSVGPTVNPEMLTTLYYVAVSTLTLLAVMTGWQMMLDLKNQKHILRQTSAIAFAIITLFMLTAPTPSTHKLIASESSASKPNIILIGFDALRPDYLSHLNQHAPATPTFDDFLKSSTVYTKAYTPLARTFPAWTTLFTGKYPLHHLAREDNINIESVKLDETLPKRLTAAGYQTIFASEDNRFSNINREFGIQELIGTNGNIVTYVMGTINDFPLSNLAIPTRFGKLFFPYHYGNHGAAATYDSNNFLDLIHQHLQQQRNQPVLLVVHFNITAFPFYYFNDHQPYSTSTSTLYQHVVQAGDQLLKQYLAELEAHGLLQHAIVILLSDHGITLAQPGDRMTTIASYQGNPNNIKLKRTKYASSKTKLNLADNKGTIKLGANDFSNSPLNSNLYGIDTSFGYGGDVLSLKQNMPLLAIRIYGDKPNIPHQVNATVLLNDIAPTILDLLQLPAMSAADGTSLKPSLYSAQHVADDRPVFLESGFSIPEIESDGIVIDNVVRHYANLFEVNPQSGMVSIKTEDAKLINTQRQRAVIAGDWMLAYYPAANRYHVLINKQTHQITYQPYIAAPYRVLVNLSSGKWTTDFTQAFAQQAPLAQLTELLSKFYGAEMEFYRHN